MSLNQIIDQDPLASLVVDNTLNLKARKLRVFGDVSASSFSINGNAIPFQTVYSIPFTVVSYDTTVERPVTGVGTTGVVTFVKTGRSVVASIPAFGVSAYSGGAASQFLRIKFNSALPAGLVPFIDANAPFQSISGGVDETTPGVASLSGSLFIELISNYFASGFTVSCGVQEPFQMSYISV